MGKSINIHFSNGDFISTDMYSEVESLQKRMSLIDDAIKQGELITGTYTTSLGAMRNARILVSHKKVVVLTGPVSNGKEK